MRISLKCLFFSICLFNVNAFSAVTDGFYGNVLNEINNQEQPIQLLMSDNESLSLLYDTIGPSFTLAIGTASDRIIRAVNVSGATGAPGVGYYSDTTCSTLIGQAGVLSAGNSFTFTDGVPIYFGETALSTLSNNDVATRCILAGLMQAADGGPSQAYIFLKVQNLTCNGTTCSGGDVCYTTPPPNGWSASGTPAC